MPRAVTVLLASLACMVAAIPVLAQQPPTPDTLAVMILAPVLVEGRATDMFGYARSASQGFVGHQDLRLRPLLREGEILESVPGLIMTQHSGDGKSNQMFVRGFNLDHGTDFSTRVEGMQVNMPSHAHGQGYTDINFIIPELVDHVEYRLGTHYAQIGDFGAAGGAELRMRRSLPAPLFSVGVGEAGYRRMVAAMGSDLGRGHVLAGLELKRYDGPWDVPQELRKLSGMARYTLTSGDSEWSLLALGYENSWAASDQIPQRLVEGGTLARWGQVDPTLGGVTSRASLSGRWTRQAGPGVQRLDVHAIHYDLDLYSNFTYFLGDPEEGDQFRQRDRGRRIVGGEFVHIQPAGRHTVTLGMQTRLDRFDLALQNSRNRELVGTVRKDTGSQWNVGLYSEVVTNWTPEFSSVVGVRGDLHAFEVSSDLEANSGDTSAFIASPKASLVYRPSPRTELYLGGGFGFHSNDARGTVQTLDPQTGEEVDPVDPLVRAVGAEVGLRTAASGGWGSTLSLWRVDLDSELLFVGDEGATEESDASRRVGITWTQFYRPGPSLTLDLDISLARARFQGVPEAENRIPGAIENVVAAGVSWDPEFSGAFASLRLRRFGSYPLIEDDSERATAASLLNLNVGWRVGQLRLGVSVMNALDASHSDIQYVYESRVPGEPGAGVTDRHFHPVEPRQLRFTATWGF